jgi:hypothetical protein
MGGCGIASFRKRGATGNYKALDHWIDLVGEKEHSLPNDPTIRGSVEQSFRVLGV